MLMLPSRRQALLGTVVLAGVLLSACLAVAQPPAANPAWLADRHAAAGLTCASCHGNAKPSDVALDTCLSCHVSYRELARKTANRLRNPHDSHYPNLECTTCHHGHQKEENFCAGCHGPD
jgi:fumarate reductase flavoprotein subunit